MRKIIKNSTDDKRDSVYMYNNILYYLYENMKNVTK